VVGVLGGGELWLTRVSLGAITTGLIVKAVDRSEDDALGAASGALRRLLGFLRERFSRDADAPTSTAPWGRRS
jgi:hypothetical protein